MVEEALSTVLRLDGVRVTCAGRTDAGVHARGQMVHVDVPAPAYDGDANALGRRLAGVLPRDVGVTAVDVAPPGFDARFSPLWRRYGYRVSDHPFGPEPLRRRDVLAHRRPLDVAAMDDAAGDLVGEHDFAAFCRRREGATTVRTLLELSWARDERRAGGRRGWSPTPSATTWSVRSSGHRWQWVKAVGTSPGRRGSWPAGERVPDVPVAPPHGLTLEEVRYPPDAELAARAAVSRRRREVPS